MVVSIDPATKEVAMLSIPRDLLVKIEDYGTTKINAAHAYGESAQSTTGPALLEETVESVLDIDINYFVRIDFQGFIDTVDTLGGVTVDVESTLYDSTIEESYAEGGIFYLKKGTHHLDGRQALQYVRCRKGTCGNDFGRAARQQQVLQIIRQKVLSAGTYANPRRAASLIDQLKEHLRVSISIDDGLRLYELTKESGSARSFVLNTETDNYLTFSSVIGGGLDPKSGHLNFTDIQRFVRGDLFRDGFLKQENASITILNGTTTPGKATETEQLLKGLGYNVTNIDNAPTQDVLNTKIYKRQSKEAPFTEHLLGLRMNTSVQPTVPDQYQQFKTDFIVVIGADQDEAQ